MDSYLDNSWLDEVLAYGPKQGEFWFVSGVYWRNPPVVQLMEQDDEMFTIPGQRPERMSGWQIEVVHSGKRVFFPSLLLGRYANAMEVIAWMAQ